MSSKRRPDVKIAVMGPTGTGKSSLIKLITGDETIKIGHSIESETSEISLSNYFEAGGRCVTFVDTPGFDDSREGVTDTIILQQIAAFLETQYEGGNSTLSGIIYLHRISDVRMGGINVRNLKMFQKLCGSDSLTNVVIVTTRWDKVDLEEGENREHELMTNANFFKPLIHNHARYLRHDGTAQSAQTIMSQVLANDPIVLQIQHELASGKKLEETEAGSELTAEMNVLVKKHKEELENLRREMEDAIKTKDDELKLELEGEQAKLRKAMDRWDEDRRRMEGGLNSVRTGARSGMEAAERHLEEMRLAFLKANGTGSANGSFGDDIGGPGSVISQPETHHESYSGTGLGSDSEWKIRSQVLQSPSGDLSGSSRIRDDFLNANGIGFLGSDVSIMGSASYFGSSSGADIGGSPERTVQSHAFQYPSRDPSGGSGIRDDFLNTNGNGFLSNDVGMTGSTSYESGRRSWSPSGTDIGQDSEWKIQSQVLQCSSGDLPASSGDRRDFDDRTRDILQRTGADGGFSFPSPSGTNEWQFSVQTIRSHGSQISFDNEDLSWQKVQFDDNSEAHHKLEGLTSDLRQVSQRKEDKDGELETLRSQLCQAIIDKLKGDRQFRNQTEQLSREVKITSDKQKTTIASFTRWRDLAVRKYSALRAEFEKEGSIWFVKIRNLEQSNSKLESELKEEKNRRKADRGKFESELEKTHRLNDDDKRRLKKEYDDVVEKKNEDIIRKDKKISETERNWEESRMTFKREREQLESTIKRHEEVIKILEAKYGNNEGLVKKLRQDHEKSMRVLEDRLRLEIDEQKKYYLDLLETERNEKAKLHSELIEEKRIRYDLGAKFERELHELKVKFEIECRQLRVEIEEWKTRYQAAEEKYKKENSGLRTELSKLSNEVRHWRELEETAKQDLTKLKVSFEGQIEKLNLQVEDLKTRYDNMVQKNKKEISLLGTELSNEKRLKKDALERAEQAEDESSELRVKFENERRQRAEIEESKRRYQAAEEKYKKEISGLRTDISNEIRLREEDKETTKQELAELRATFEKQGKAYQGSMKDQKDSYDELIQKLKDEFGRLQARLVEESRGLRVELEKMSGLRSKESEDLKEQLLRLENLLKKQKADCDDLVKENTRVIHIMRIEKESEISELKCQFQKYQVDMEREIETKNAQISLKVNELYALRTQLSNEELRIKKLEWTVQEGIKKYEEIEFRLNNAISEKEGSDNWWRGQLDLEKDRTNAARAMFNEMIEQMKPPGQVVVPAIIPPKPSRPDIMIAVMGSTGTGKSSLIQLLTGDTSIRVGHGVESETSEIRLAHFFEPDGRRITLVDTPGFDDSRQDITDADILNNLAAFLKVEFNAGKKLNGVMYLHRIDDIKVGGLSLRNIRMFEKLCGPDGLKNVAIVTTRWDKVSEVEGEGVEGQLKRNEYFKRLSGDGATFLRHYGTSDSAIGIMKYFFDKEPVTLQIQIEIIKERKKIEETGAGAELAQQLNQLVQMQLISLEEVRRQLEAAKSINDEARKRVLELSQENGKIFLDKMEEAKKSLAKELAIERALAQREHEEWRLQVLNSQQEIKMTIKRLRSYEELAPKLEATAYKRDTADFWAQRRLNATGDKNNKAEAIVEFDGLIRRMLQMGSENSNDGSEPIIAVMGATGTGKSTFIWQLTGDNSVVIGHNVESETSKVSEYRYLGEGGQSVTLIDTPGFDDSHESEGITDVTILEMIATFLDKQFKDGKRLSGLIYLHRITDNRVGGSHTRIMRMFRKICGTRALKNVAVVTTRWDGIKEESEGIKREQQLLTSEKYLKPFVDAGAQFIRHTGTFGSARRIVEGLLKNSPMELQIQRELADGKKLEDTDAGNELAEEIRVLVKRHEAEINQLKEEMREAIQQKDEQWRKEVESERNSKVKLIEELDRGLKILHQNLGTGRAEQQIRDMQGLVKNNKVYFDI